MALLAKQTIDLDGLVATYGAAAGGGDTFPAGDRIFLHVKNGSGGAITVTVVTPGTAAGGLAIADSVSSVGAGAEAFIGPFPAEAFADPADGLAHVTYSGVTSLTVAVLEAPRR